MNKKLYVGNLLYEVSDEDLKQHFSQAGNVVSAQVIRYR
ncbi:RNA-binding protein, partial [Candidatus Roizmanbacteria bacterium]|nr:RNA-binding protein [Candidatus Roizmanbacteria bacterium]